MIIKIKKLNPEAKLPIYAHPGDAGMDFFALAETEIKPGEVVRVKTGIALELPVGYVGLIWDKSGLAANHGLKTMAGVLDAGYRGELQIVVTNLSKEIYSIKKHDKVAQMLIQRIESPELIEVDELSDTSRGEGGFGSTGK
ncbi:MAG TPA: dUTP diphosphatase [Candidatus Paceibacterota bacterium]|jgi:dUTP pyrophosphatase|nr:dUTP diphosphatase [Candidatus Paceibacterota bacterium]HOH11235.1 dUTP diphosphatase [Candidatus Paceibacterota bacterium]HOY10945.1 dUTP diphosphatase [Candidatus Paceibacterota bacterium]HPB60279.1 dUTP diphosphatase [Candidatus Paceibacterota bacterium]HPI24391.1 dUTP diphosphatase [Candidatus Paceibacterota bacterium]